MSSSNTISGSAGNGVERERPSPIVRAPLALALLGALIIGILALLYVHEVAGLTAANDELHALQAEQTRLERQDAELHAQFGEVTSPEYIDRRARAMGLIPGGAGNPVTVVVVRGADSGGEP